MNPSQENERVTLSRDVTAYGVPSGQETTLFKGTEVRIMQTLGGTFTVVTHQGSMATIQGRDADALGKEIPAEAQMDENAATDLKSVEKQVWEKLRTCYDPEIPYNIVDLGLIYGCDITPLEGGKHRVTVTMTLTAPGCGMGDVIRGDARMKILSLPGVAECEVEVVFDPPWDPGKMNPALRREMY